MPVRWGLLSLVRAPRAEDVAIVTV